MQTDVNTTILTDEEKARLMKNRYQREWASKNKDKVRASQIKHFAKKYDEFIAKFEAELESDGDSNEQI